LGVFCSWTPDVLGLVLGVLWGMLLEWRGVCELFTSTGAAIARGLEW